MQEYDREWARKALDTELAFAFVRNKWEIARSLLSFARTVGVISSAEQEWLRKAIRCLD